MDLLHGYGSDEDSAASDSSDDVPLSQLRSKASKSSPPTHRKVGFDKGHATIKYDNVGVYKGDVIDGKVGGKCKFTYANGEVYAGDWADDAPNGWGKVKYADEDVDRLGAYYEGEWEDGLEHGKGTLKEANGTEYKQEYSSGELLSSKRVAILIHGPSSQRQRINEAVGVVVLNDEEMRCGICGDDYFFDTDSADEDAKKRLPVISSCDHTCCHGCILKWQVARAEMNNGRVAKRVNCMVCKKKSAICPSEPKYDRRLIDLLARCSR